MSSREIGYIITTLLYICLFFYHGSLLLYDTILLGTTNSIVTIHICIRNTMSWSYITSAVEEHRLWKWTWILCTVVLYETVLFARVFYVRLHTLLLYLNFAKSGIPVLNLQAIGLGWVGLGLLKNFNVADVTK